MNAAQLEAEPIVRLRLACGHTAYALRGEERRRGRARTCHACGWPVSIIENYKVERSRPVGLDAQQVEKCLDQLKAHGVIVGYARVKAFRVKQWAIAQEGEIDLVLNLAECNAFINGAHAVAKMFKRAKDKTAAADAIL